MLNINKINRLQSGISLALHWYALMDVKQIRELARKYTAGQIEGCITQQIDTGQNICLADKNSETVVNELSKADVVRELLDKGMSLADSLRELARQMRLVQQGFQEEDE